MKVGDCEYRMSCWNIKVRCFVILRFVRLKSVLIMLKCWIVLHSFPCVPVLLSCESKSAFILSIAHCRIWTLTHSIGSRVGR
jgi:hypothetical protein